MPRVWDLSPPDGALPRLSHLMDAPAAAEMLARSPRRFREYREGEPVLPIDEIFANLTARELKVQMLERQLAKSVVQREGVLKQKESDLAVREQNVLERTGVLNEREAAAQAREEALKLRERAVRAREDQMFNRGK